jgi:hypothetical protein
MRFGATKTDFRMVSGNHIFYPGDTIKRQMPGHARDAGHRQKPHGVHQTSQHCQHCQHYQRIATDQQRQRPPHAGDFKTQQNQLLEDSHGGSTWTPEQRQRQREAIQRWRPWSKSTGPRSLEGKTAASRNAWTAGHLVMLRLLTKQLNEALRGQSEWLG